MKVLVTGSAGGIGRATALRFLTAGHQVVGMDILPGTIHDPGYSHFVQDITGELPDIPGVEILVNNAGVQNSGRDIAVNLQGTIAVTEKYGIHEGIHAIVFVASAAATTGAEFPEYAASKGGMLSYMKNVALRVAPFGATSNSISAGGVLTALNRHILESPALYEAVLQETMLHKWATPEEIAEFIYFLSAVNVSMTGEDIFVDNGEKLKSNFIW